MYYFKSTNSKMNTISEKFDSKQEFDEFLHKIENDYNFYDVKTLEDYIKDKDIPSLNDDFILHIDQNNIQYTGLIVGRIKIGNNDRLSIIGYWTKKSCK